MLNVVTLLVLSIYYYIKSTNVINLNLNLKLNFLFRCVFSGIFRIFSWNWGQMLLIGKIFIWSTKSRDCRSAWSGTFGTLFRALVTIHYSPIYSYFLICYLATCTIVVHLLRNTMMSIAFIHLRQWHLRSSHEYLYVLDLTWPYSQA
jgi:hypothetical protein